MIQPEHIDVHNARQIARYQRKEYPSDGIASLTAILQSLEFRIGKEMYSQITAGEAYITTALRKHRHEHPDIERAYHEVWALDYHRQGGSYQRACEYMRDEGYSGIYWMNGMW